LKKGFSLLEIIFVVVIIGIIAMLALPKLGNIGSDAKVNAIKQDIFTLKSNLQSYYLLNQKIDKISDVVSLNPKTWDIADKKVIYKDNEKECISLSVDEKNISIVVNNNDSTICQKLGESGIISETIALN
jgi:general secretion pathway protein G